MLSLVLSAQDADKEAHYKTNPQAYEIESKMVSSQTILQLLTVPGGGFAIKITPIQPE